jgi:putative colanic acid biosynthesis acetyltransferase WcaF
MKTFITKIFPGAKYYSFTDYLRRFCWSLLFPFFRFSPRHLYFFRNFILKILGADIGSGVKIYPDVWILNPHNLVIGNNVNIGWGVKLYALGKIYIGSNTVISQYTHLCAGSHDYKSNDFALLKLNLSVGENVWVAADAFIGPGVLLGDSCIVAARSVVIKNVPNGVLVGGNPAKIIKVL